MKRVDPLLQTAYVRLVPKDALFIGQETGESQRVLHLHARPGSALETRLRTWAIALGVERGLSGFPDPRWDVLQKWRSR